MIAFGFAEIPPSYKRGRKGRERSNVGVDPHRTGSIATDKKPKEQGKGGGGKTNHCSTHIPALLIGLPAALFDQKEGRGGM